MPMPNPGAPARAHGGNRLSTHSTIESEGFNMTNFDLPGGRPRGDDDRHRVSGNTMFRPPACCHSCSCAYPRDRPVWRAFVVLMKISAAHTFVDHVFDAHRRIPLHVHADLENTVTMPVSDKRDGDLRRTCES
jgi:hypothetical protein